MWSKVLVNFCENIKRRSFSFHNQTLSNCSFARSLLSPRSLTFSLICTCYLLLTKMDLHRVLRTLLLFLVFSLIKPQVQQFTLRPSMRGCRLQQELHIQDPQSVNFGPSNRHLFLFYSNFLCITKHCC